MNLRELLRLAERLLAQGETHAAMAALQQAVAEHPASALAWRRLAEILGSQGVIEEACFAWMQAIALAPEDPIPLRGLAQILHDHKEFEQALPLWQMADQLEAADVRTLFHLGQCLLELGRASEGLAVVERAHALAPLDPRPITLLAQIQRRRGQLSDAERWLRLALGLAPENAEYISNLGVVLDELDQLEEAIERHRTAINLAPSLISSWRNLALALRHAGELDEAITVLREAHDLAPRDPDVLWELGCTQLLRGDAGQGWQGYEARFSKSNPERLVVQPPSGRWAGPDLEAGALAEPLDTLVLIGEQGWAEMLQFVRYAPLMHRFARRVELCLPSSLHGLLGAAELADGLCTPEQLLDHPPQAWLPLLSAPRLLGVEPHQPLLQAPYLRADPQRQRHWQERLGPQDGPLIGINWQASSATTEVGGSLRGRSVPLEALAPLAELPGIRLLSLQQGPGMEAWASCSFADRFVAIQAQVDAAAELADRAALMACCDLIISSESAVPHLAGALGLPVWLLLCSRPDWRWGLEGESCPWYPSMTLVRQKRLGDWQQPIEAARQALCRHFALSPAVDPGRVEPKTVAVAALEDGDDAPPMGPPESPAALRQRALALEKAQDHRAALPLWRQLLAKDPQDLETLLSTAQCLHHLEQNQQARSLGEQAHALDPAAPGPLSLLGVLALNAGAVSEAEGWLRRAVEQAPDNPRYLNNLAAALKQTGQTDAAIELLQQALALAPELSGIRLNLSRNLGHRGEIDAALHCLEEGLAREPTNPDLLWNHGLTQLLLGDYEAGWRGYQARFATSEPVRLIGNPAGRRWSPAAVDGERPPQPTLRLVGEQGLGDIIQFARYLPLMRRYAERLEFCVPISLARLMRDSQLADGILTPDQMLKEPAPDWLPLLSVPQLLGVTPDRTLVQEPYLRSDPERRAHWQKCLGPDEGLLVGINWQGSPNKIGDSHLNQRSFPLEALAPIAALAGVRLVSLQKGHGMEQRSLCSFADRFVAVQEEIDDRLDFREVAAVLDCCDLVISCDTVIPHLAAALGRPTWTLLCAQPEWRWGQEGASTHWYPTMQLFRQDRMGSWEEPVQRLRDQLRTWLASGNAPAPRSAS